MGQRSTFISYARADGEFVLRLAEELRAKGVSLWLDQLDISAGEPWEESIERALEECESVLLVLSPVSVKSENVKDEISYALGEKKKILPLMYQSCKIPLRLNRLHYVDFTGAYEKGFRSLLKELNVREVAEQAPPPSPVVEKPAAVPEPKKPVQTPEVIPAHENFTENLPGGVKLEMIAIPGGSFMMGSEADEDEDEDSQPVHNVTLKPFHMGKYQVTQAQWKAVMGKNPSNFKGDNLPVDRVSWDDAKEFCKKLSEMTGKEYRLPSEAEWEYAARAGSKGDYCFGDDENLLGEYAWYGKNSDGKTHPVGQKQPNAWGLYDLHGNVWEWCEDIWHDNYNGAPTDGTAWLGPGSDRVKRGGSWCNVAVDCRSALRGNNSPGGRGHVLGFRLVRIGR